MDQGGRLRRRQVIALIMVVIWAALLVIGLFGQDVGIPRSVTVPAGVTALVVLAFLIPGAALFGLLRDRQPGRSTSRQVWLEWRWRFAISGMCMAVIASGLLLPATRVGFVMRVGGIIGLIWALLALWVAVLAFQAKLRVRAPQDGRVTTIWWTAHWARVALITLSVTAAWIVFLAWVNSRLS